MKQVVCLKKMAEFIQFETDVVEEHCDSGKSDEGCEMGDDEVSSVIYDSFIDKDYSICNSNIPNITRSFDDPMNNDSSNFEDPHGECFN